MAEDLPAISLAQFHVFHTLPCIQSESLTSRWIHRGIRTEKKMIRTKKVMRHFKKEGFMTLCRRIAIEFFEMINIRTRNGRGLFLPGILFKVVPAVLHPFRK